MAADLDIDTGPADTGWAQTTVRIDDYANAELVGTTHLGPLMTAAEHSGLITCWWFIRKRPYWRLRWRPTPNAGQDPNHAVRQALSTLCVNGTIDETVTTIYEPEVHAFGGDAAMERPIDSSTPTAATSSNTSQGTNVASHRATSDER